MAGVTALKYGETVLPGHMVFAGGDPKEIYPISLVVYLVEIGEKKILVDAGCETMPGFEVVRFETPMAILKRYGVAAEEITDIMITHAHHDHIQCVKDFPNAVVWIQQEELAAGRAYIPDGANVRAFENECQTGCVRLRKIGGHSCGSCVAEIQMESGMLTVAGDECYRRECLTQKRRTGCSVCPEKSQAFVETYGEGRWILLCHDPEILPGENGFLRIV